MTDAGQGDALRIVHAPKNPAGLATELAAAERSAGHHPTVITARADFTERAVDHCHNLDQHRGIRRAVDHVRASRQLPAADLLHLWYGASFVHWPRFGVVHGDLRRLARQTPIVASWVGSDARDMFRRRSDLRGPAAQSIGGRLSGAQLRWLNRNRQRGIDSLGEFAAQQIVWNPDLLADVPGATFVPYAVSRPNASAVSAPAATAQQPIRIVHAPTNRALKGTRHVLASIERLQERLPGRIDFRLLTRAPRDRVLAEIAAADLVIDQLLIGWYGVTAVEAMLLGTPVVGWVDDLSRSLIPSSMAADLALFPAQPSTLDHVLEQAIRNPDQRHAVREAGRNFAQRWHDPVAVQSQVMSLYEAALKPA